MIYLDAGLKVTSTKLYAEIEHQLNEIKQDLLREVKIYDEQCIALAEGRAENQAKMFEQFIDQLPQDPVTEERAVGFLSSVLGISEAKDLESSSVDVVSDTKESTPEAVHLTKSLVEGMRLKIAVENKEELATVVASCTTALADSFVKIALLTQKIGVFFDIRSLHNFLLNALQVEDHDRKGFVADFIKVTQYLIAGLEAQIACIALLQENMFGEAFQRFHETENSYIGLREAAQEADGYPYWCFHNSRRKERPSSFYLPLLESTAVVKSFLTCINEKVASDFEAKRFSQVRNLVDSLLNSSSKRYLEVPLLAPVRQAYVKSLLGESSYLDALLAKYQVLAKSTEYYEVLDIPKWILMGLIAEKPDLELKMNQIQQDAQNTKRAMTNSHSPNSTATTDDHRGNLALIALTANGSTTIGDGVRQSSADEKVEHAATSSATKLQSSPTITPLQ